MKVYQLPNIINLLNFNEKYLNGFYFKITVAWIALILVILIIIIIVNIWRKMI